jgi:ACS family hexuronate transporter-like MFS transporter
VRIEAAESLDTGRSKYWRWGICGLLFFATTINYVDRQVLGILKPTLQTQFGWRESDYSWIVVAFQLAYAVMMPFAGRLMDRVGTRVGYAVAVAIWSIAALSHAFARSAGQFIAARFSLGLGEAGNFPAAIRTVADWFPQEERSLATGIFNSGTNLGVVIAAVLVPAVTLRFGWQAAFFVTGGLGFLWIVPWLMSGGSSVSVNRGRSGPLPDTATADYRTLLGNRGSWAFIIGKFVTDPVWWFYSFWIPSFLSKAYGVDLTAIGPPLITIYVAADAGSIAGGWLYKGFASLGWTPNTARKVAMLICAVAATPVMLLLWVQSLWLGVALLSLAAAAHQGWSVNLFTVVSDTFPKRDVASVVGLGGLSGGVSGLIISPLVGYWLDFSNGAYRPIFLLAGTAYLGALLLIQAVVPQLGKQRS